MPAAAQDIHITIFIVMLKRVFPRKPFGLMKALATSQHKPKILCAYYEQDIRFLYLERNTFSSRNVKIHKKNSTVVSTTAKGQGDQLNRESVNLLLRTPM